MEREEIVKKMTELLPVFPDGAAVSVVDLAKTAGFQGEVNGVFDIYKQIKEIVKTKGIQLLPYECEYCDEGLPYNITFVKRTC